MLFHFQMYWSQLQQFTSGKSLVIAFVWNGLSKLKSKSKWAITKITQFKNIPYAIKKQKQKFNTRAPAIQPSNNSNSVFLIKKKEKCSLYIDMPAMCVSSTQFLRPKQKGRCILQLNFCERKYICNILKFNIIL